MDRLQNAQKSLAKSLDALESVVTQLQNSASQPSESVAGSDYNIPDALGADRQLVGAATVSLRHLSQEVSDIETDLERAIQMITELTAQHLSGDGR